MLFMVGVLWVRVSRARVLNGVYWGRVLWRFHLSPVLSEPLKAFQHILSRPVQNERVHFLSFPGFTAETKVFQHVLIRSAKNESVRAVAFSVFTSENHEF